MSHLDVDIIDFLILTKIPVAVLFVIEMICRAIKTLSWIKLTVQGIMMVSFAVAYMTVITPHHCHQTYNIRLWLVGKISPLSINTKYHANNIGMGFANEKFTICKTHAKKFNGPKNAPYAKETV